VDEQRTYDAAGRTVCVHLPDAPASVNLNWYTGLGHLAGTDWSNDVGNGWQREQFRLDGFGNVRERWTAGEPYVYYNRVNNLQGWVSEVIRDDTISGETWHTQDTRDFDEILCEMRAPGTDESNLEATAGWTSARAG
jgi:hypothetical protein